MSDAPDVRLLEQFARNDSEEAFAALVQRHIGLVHSVALRHTANPQHAQDITQAVFIILARKAGTLGRGIVLPGWLYHTARLTAANFQRAESSRIRREQETFMQSTLNETAPDAVWRELSPLLDEAMACLGASERNAVVLRYFQNKSMAEVGESLGLEENTAQKRVGRALEKLRKFFNKRGITLSAVAIASVVSANSVQAVPVRLAATITATATKGSTATTSTLTLVKGALKLMAWTKAKTAIVAGVVVLLAAGTTTLSIMKIAPRRAANGPIAGIGATLAIYPQSQEIQFMDIIPNSPAARVGLSNGWMLAQIDGVPVRGMKLAECVSLLRGPAGTKVSIDVVNPNTHLFSNFQLTRQILTNQSTGQALSNSPPPRILIQTR